MSTQDLPVIPSLHLGVAALLCFCAGGLYGWSALVPIIENDFDGSTAQAGRVFSVAIASFTLAVLVIPRLAEFAQCLFVSGVIATIGAVSLLLASVATHYWLFLVLFSVGFGFVSGGLYINVLTLAASTDRARWLTPVMVAVFGLGGVVFGPLWRQLVALGWGTYSLLPLACLMLVGSAWAMYVDKRSAASWSPLLFKWRSLKQQVHTVDKSGGWSTTDHRLLLIWGIFATGSMAGLMVLGLASKIIEHAGGSVNVASAGIAGIALGNTLGRLSVSVQLLYIGSTRVAIVASLTVSIGLLFVLASAAADTTAIGLALVALGYGIMASAIPVVVRRQFGTARFATRFSIVFTAWGLAGLVSPWLAGVLFDASGSFSSAIYLALVITLVCSCLLIWFAWIDRLDAP